MEQLKDKIIGRTEQINMLFSLMSKEVYWKPACIYISGPPSSGKTLVVTNVFKLLDCYSIYINCLECYMPSLLFDQILVKLNEYTGKSMNLKASKRCDNLSDFIHSLRDNIEEQNGKQKTVCIILDQAERLREMDSNVLPAMVRLQELTNRKVSVILISNLYWIKFGTSTGVFHPLTINFPQYSKDEAHAILMSKRPLDCDEEFYNRYLSLIISVFYNVCRDVVELNYLTQLNFPKYCQPVKNGAIESTDFLALWKNFDPTLKTALKSVYLRKVSSFSWSKDGDDISDENQLSLSIELPFYSKYLLIASFIASYNSPKDDQKLFMKERRSFRKRQKKRQSISERHCSLVQGPKPFALDRMLSIFSAIVDEKVPSTFDILHQVSTLASLEMIALMKSQDSLLKPKYKCILPLDVVSSVSKTVDFPLEQYLLNQD